MKVSHKLIVGIIGGHTHNTTPEALRLAEYTGAELGRRGIAIICGGESGIMEAACKGCKQAGGVTFGVMKGNLRESANQYVDYPLLTSLDLASNNIIIWTASGIIAFDGMYGTLTEMGLALDIGRPLISFGKQRLIDVSKVKSEYFAYYDTYDTDRAGAVIDHLLRMIEEQSL